MNPDISFFILAGGLGTRTLPLSLIKAKPAFPLNGVPLIAIMLERLSQCGMTKGFINLHHLPETIMESVSHFSGLAIHYLHEENLSGSRILTVAAPAAKEWLLVMNGDVFFDLTPEWLNQMIAAANSPGARNADGALMLRPNENPEYSNVLIDEKSGVFKGVTPWQGGPALMYAGVALFRPHLAAAINHQNFFNTLMSQNFTIQTLISRDIWLDIGAIPIYLQADKLYRRFLCAHNPNNDFSANSLSSGAFIDPHAQVSDSILWENSRIGDQVSLKNCIVAGNLALNHVKLENSLIRNSPNGIIIEPF